jgi:ParB-like chromosome segregation protein Spo0J
MAFERRGLILPLDKIFPTKRLKDATASSPKYKRVLASIRVLGIIEPIVVYPQSGKSGNYILLDGHMRLHALKDLGVEETFCLVATEDETVTYNHKVNQLSPIQEHFMILKAIENGVSEERIAETLDVDVKAIRGKRDLLKGICPEAVDLLRERRASPVTIRELRRVKPLRQIEIVELMIAANNFTSSHVKCLVAATQKDQLVDPDKPKSDELSPDEVARIEREMASISDDFRAIEDSHGRNVLNLVIAVGYLQKLLDNAAVVKFISRKDRDVLHQFQQIADTTSLDEG